MNVASLELAHELHSLSGWETGTKFGHPGSGLIAPNYDLGYLLAKLPQSIDNKEYGYRWRWHLTPLGEGGHGYNISYQNNIWVTAHRSSLKRKGLEDDEIEQLTHWRPPHWSYEAADAVAKLVIELFKQGILTKEGAS